MRVRTYFEEKCTDYEDVTFIKARARKDAHTPFYHSEYQTTPIWPVREWMDSNNERLLNSIILNDNQIPIDWLCGASWRNMVKAGRLKCLLVISEEDLELLYPSEEQRKSMEEFIDKKIK